MFSCQLKYIFSIPRLLPRFLCFPRHPSSTHWHAFCYQSPSPLYPSFPSLTGLYYQIISQSEWNAKFLQNYIYYHQTALSVFFLQLYFSMSSNPSWDKSNLLWQSARSDKLLMDGDGCRTALDIIFKVSFTKLSRLCLILYDIGWEMQVLLGVKHVQWIELWKALCACYWINETMM